MPNRFAVLLVSAVMTWTLAAGSSTPAQTIMGAGMISCGEWVRLRSFEGREGQHFQELASLYQVQAWVDGFVSGINSNIDPADTKGPDLLASKPGGVAMYAWMDNYCRSSLSILSLVPSSLWSKICGHERNENRSRSRAFSKIASERSPQQRWRAKCRSLRLANLRTMSPALTMSTSSCFTDSGASGAR
jgi:hypothetical protein